MKKFLIIGLGVSGISAAELLADEASVSAFDDRPEEKFDTKQLNALRKKGISLFFKEMPDVSAFDTLVLSPGVHLDIPAVIRAKELGLEITGELELGWEHCKGKVIGITGTNGKTTTTSLIYEILKSAGKNALVCGNIGIPITGVCKKSDPSSIIAAEVSSYQLETASNFHPHISLLLNLTPDHLDRHGSFEEYASVKARIFANQNENDYLIFNAEDPETCAIIKQKSPKAALFAFSKAELASYEGLSGGAYVSDGIIRIRFGSDDFELCPAAGLKIPGQHNLENALAAAAAAFLAGADLSSIKDTLSSFPGVVHRIEFVRELDGVRYINDSKGTNPDASVKAVQAFDRPIILIAGGYDKKIDMHEFFESIKGRVKALVLLGETKEYFKECALACGFGEESIHICGNMPECVDCCRKISESGDIVLLSPASASWDMYSSYEERGLEFKALVNKL